jgi:hypothetical protein
VRAPLFLVYSLSASPIIRGMLCVRFGCTVQCNMYSPLQLACENSHLGAARLLLDRGADASLRMVSSGGTNLLPRPHFGAAVVGCGPVGIPSLCNQFESSCSNVHSFLGADRPMEAHRWAPRVATAGTKWLTYASLEGRPLTSRGYAVVVCLQILTWGPDWGGRGGEGGGIVPVPRTALIVTVNQLTVAVTVVGRTQRTVPFWMPSVVATLTLRVP